MKIYTFKLKVLSLILMFIEHIYNFIPNRIPVWITYPGRIVAPIFFYFMVEGFFYARSRFWYAKRIFSWAIVMLLGTKLILLLLNVKTIDTMINSIYLNIFLSLGCGVVLLSVIEWIKDNKFDKLNILLGLVLLIAISRVMMFLGTNIFGVFMTLIFYFFRDKKKLMVVAYLGSFLTLKLGYMFIYNIPFTYKALFIDDFQWMMVFGIIPILIYSRERELNNIFSK